MEDCLAPGVPKIKKKANGAKGPLIPRKETRYGEKTNRRHKDNKGSLTYSLWLA